MAMGVLKTSTVYLLLLYFTLFISTSCRADKYTAKVDYGYGPLFIELSTKGEKLIRCDKLEINIGGGFGPYRLLSVNAADKSMPVHLTGKDNKTAEWEVAISEGSHVAFNITDRSGATFQTPLLEVKSAPPGVKCGNSTAYLKSPDKKKDDENNSGASRLSKNDNGYHFVLSMSLVMTVLIAALSSIWM